MEHDEARHRAEIPAALADDALLSLPAAGRLASLSVSTVYRYVAADPTFPRLIRLSTRCTRIRAGDMRAWLASKAGA